MQARIVLLPGDGVGPEVVAEAQKVLEAIAQRFGHGFSFETHLMGGCAIDATGEPLPASTLAACKQSDAVLLGAVALTVGGATTGGALTIGAALGVVSFSG